MASGGLFRRRRRSPLLLEGKRPAMRSEPAIGPATRRGATGVPSGGQVSRTEAAISC